MAWHNAAEVTNDLYQLWLHLSPATGPILLLFEDVLGGRQDEHPMEDSIGWPQPAHFSGYGHYFC
jgi:hypothetical protein